MHRTFIFERIMHSETVAVITGDINGSSKLPPDDIKQLEGLLHDCYSASQQAFPDGELAGFSCFRGDAWQFVVHNPQLAPRINLFFRAVLLDKGHEITQRKLHSAAALGFGTIDFLPDRTSSAGGGIAYERSGKRLDKLRRRMPGVGVAGLGALDSCLDSMLGLIDALNRQWTPLQAKAVTFALQGMTQQEIAAQWHPPVSQQAANKHLLAAGWPAIDPALSWIESTITGCFSEYNR